MAGVKTLRKLQFGAESTPGTEVNASTVWRGLGVLADNTEVQFSDEDVGLMAPTLRSYIPRYDAELSLGDTECTFEQFCYLLSAGVKDVSGVQDGAGSGYVWTYPFPTTAQNTVKTYSIEGGDNQQEEQMLYAFCREFGLSGEPGAAVMMNGVMVGRRVQPGTFTGSVAIPSVENVLFQRGKLYIDNNAGSFGGTQISNAFVGMSLSVTTGVVAYWTGDGELHFTGIDYVRPTLELELTFRHTADAVAEIANFRAETPRLVRIEFTGSNLATAGAETTKRLTIDVAGKYQTIAPLDDSDGNGIRGLTMRVGYEETAAEFAQIEIVNELSALP